MKGEIVVVRAYGDEPLIRRVWDADGQTVYISSSEQFALLMRGHEALMPIGFPRQDIFHYDPEIEPLIRSGKVNWQRLTPY